MNLFGFIPSTRSFDIVMFGSHVFFFSVFMTHLSVFFVWTSKKAAHYKRLNEIINWKLNQFSNVQFPCFKKMVKSEFQSGKKKRKKKRISLILCRNSWSFFGGCGSDLVFCMFYVFLKSHRLRRDIFYTYLLYSWSKSTRDVFWVVMLLLSCMYSVCKKPV